MTLHMKGKKPTFVIAEAGVNHNGSIELAKALIDAAANAGADAVKFQSFKTEKLVTKSAVQAEYQKRNMGAECSQFDMLKKLELSEDQQILLAEYCNRKQIEFMSTAFDVDSLQFLNGRLQVNRFKIGSGDLTNLPFLWEHACYKKPVILSTGMSDLSEIDLALSVLALGYFAPKETPSMTRAQEIYQDPSVKKMLKNYVTLLHCTSNYPAPLNEINLNVLDTLSDAFELSVGYSDHSEGILVPAIAVAKGAIVIEKHFTLDRSLPGPDHKASLEPDELSEMVRQIKKVETVLGSYEKSPTAAECMVREVARKSIVANNPIAKGELLTNDNMSLMRPGSGLSPKHYWDLLNKPAQKNYQPGELLGEKL